MSYEEEDTCIRREKPRKAYIIDGRTSAVSRQAERQTGFRVWGLG